MRKTIGIGKRVVMGIFFVCIFLFGLTLKTKSMTTAYAASGLAYQVTKGECYITGRGTETGSTLVIPATINGYKVKGIKETAFYNGTFTSVTIENGVEEIGTSAFGNCGKLTKITLPDSIKEIGEDAFYNTAYVKNKSNWENNEAVYIGKYLIDTNSAETEETFEIKDGTTLIAEYAMFFSYNLKNLVVPESLKIIGDSAFGDCNSLDKVYYKGTKSWYIETGENNEDFESAKKYYYSETQPNKSGRYWHYVSGQITEWPAHTHSYTSSITKVATCTEKGEKTYTCVCGNSYTEQIPSLGHNFSIFVSSTSSSCTEGGETVYKCSRCNQTRTTIGTALGHNYISTVHAATCTEKGYTEHICSRCKDSYKDKETAALGHAYQKEVVEATCTEPGGMKYTCTRCGKNYSDGEIAPLGHSYVVRTVAATCEQGGYTEHTCSRCGESYKDNESLPLGHNYVSVIKAATCTEYGKTVYTCQVCGHEYEEQNTVYPTGHNYSNFIVKAATCTEDGKRRYVCDKCGEEYTETIPAAGHNYAITDSVSENGKTIRVYACTVCGDSYTQELGNQYEEVSSYVEELFERYRPYMIWVFLSTAGVWSIAMGVAFAIAQKNEDKEKAKKMLINYCIGLVAIFAILVACPYLVRGIAALVT